MEIDDTTAREIEREVRAIGTHARASSSEQKKYTDAMVDNARDELRRELRARMDGLERKQQREVEQIECVIRRGGVTAETGQDGTTTMLLDRGAPETKAFEAFVRGGPDRLGEPERKLLSASTDPAGGYLVPASVAPSIIHK